MRKGVKIGAVVALVIALTSCSNSTDTTAPSTEPVGFANVETDTTPTPEPVQTEAPEPAALTEAETAYLELVRTRNDRKEIAAATDEELVALAHQACEELAVTPDQNALRLFPEETANSLGFYNSSATVGVFAGETICPGLIPPQQ